MRVISAMRIELPDYRKEGKNEESHKALKWRVRRIAKLGKKSAGKEERR